MSRKEINIYIIIFSVAFLFRLISVFSYSAPLAGDEVCWNNLAVSIADYGKYSSEVEFFSRPPGYPFFISIIYFLFGCNLVVVRIAQAILDSLLCILIYKLCLKVFNRSTALLASFTSVFYLLFIKGVSRFLTESLFTFVLFLVVFYIYKTKERFIYRNIYILGICVAGLPLIKGITVLFLPFLILVLLVIRFYRPAPLRDVFKKLVVMSIAFIIPISLWTYRNYRLHQTLVPISTQGGFAIYCSYFPRDGKIFGVNAVDENVSYAISLNSQVETSRYLTRKVFEFIKKHPFEVLRLELLKVFYFWVPIDWEMMGDDEGIYNFQYMFILPFSLFGMFLLLRKFYQYVFLYIPILYLFFMGLVFYASPRFRMPVEPYLIIFFTIGILRFFKMFKNKYVPGLISAAYLGINFIMYLNFDLTKQIFRNLAISLGLWW